MKTKTHILATVALAASAILTTQSGYAGTAESASAKTIIEKKDELSAFDKIWSLATLYKNDENPFIQEFKLRGRYQGQYWWVDSGQGRADDWENRRSRFGFDAKLFNKKIEIRLDAQSNDEFDPFYDGLVDAFIKWKPAREFSLTLGRQKPQIGYFDFLQSTNSQPTFERSLIFNNLNVDRVVGAVAEGRVDRFTWQAGVYSNSIDKEFGEFDGGVSFGAGFGYDFKDTLRLNKADWRFDYLHSDANDNANILTKFENLFSTTVWVADGRWSGVAEAFYGQGNSPDVFGFYLQPTYDLIPKRLQAVLRYTFATGDGPDALTAQRRYERAAPDLTGGGRGDRYNACYLGLQYFVYGDKLKFLAGAEYADLSGGGNGGDYDGWTFLTGVRFSF